MSTQTPAAPIHTESPQRGTTVPGVAPDSDVPGATIWGLLRLAMGWVFLWAFLDKLLGLGFATGRDDETGVVDRFGDAAWINGGSPTEGFLKFGLQTKGFLVDFYSGLAGQAWIDWIYMASMLLIGVALMLGVFTRLAALGGIVWMALFYSASALWPANNPFLDDHVVYAIVLAGIIVVSGGRYLGFGRRWEQLPLVRRNRWLA